MDFFSSKLHELKEVVLRSLLVYGTKLSHDLSSLVPSIRDLDISDNLVPSWERVADITKQLSKLKSLNVRCGCRLVKRFFFLTGRGS